MVVSGALLRGGVVFAMDISDPRDQHSPTVSDLRLILQGLLPYLINTRPLLSTQTVLSQLYHTLPAAYMPIRSRKTQCHCKEIRGNFSSI